MKRKVLAILAALGLLPALAACQTDDSYTQVADTVQLDDREYDAPAPVYTEGTPDETFARIDRDANGG